MSKGPFSKIIAPSIGNNPAFLPGVQSQILNHDQAAEPWVPSDEGLILWLKAENYNGTTWTDLSPNGYNATLTSTGASPTLQANVLNGQPVVRFTGGKYFTFASGVNVITEPNPYTIVVVFKATQLPSGDYGSLLSMQTKSTAQQFFFIQNFDTVSYGTVCSGGGIGNPGGTGANIYDVNYYTDFIALLQSYAGGNFNTLNNYTSRIDNIVQATLSGGVNNSPGGGSLIGALTTGGDGRLKGDIAEIIVFDSVLDANGLANLNNYLYNLYLLGTNGSWTPLDIPSVYCYFDSDQSAVDDLSGNALYITDLTGLNHGINTTAVGTPVSGKTPIVPNSLNGQQALDFSGGGVGGRIGTAGEQMSNPNEPFSFGYVVHPNTLGSTEFSSFLKTGGAVIYDGFTTYYAASDSSLIPFNFCVELDANGGPTGQACYLSRNVYWNYDDVHTLIVNYNGAGDYHNAANFEVFINGVSVTLIAQDMSGSNDTNNWLGNQGDPPNIGMGLMYSVVYVKNANISASDRSNLLAFWNTRFGV